MLLIMITVLQIFNTETWNKWRVGKHSHLHVSTYQWRTVKMNIRTMSIYYSYKNISFELPCPNLVNMLHHICFVCFVVVVFFLFWFFVLLFFLGGGVGNGCTVFQMSRLKSTSMKGLLVLDHILFPLYPVHLILYIGVILRKRCAVT